MNEIDRIRIGNVEKMIKDTTYESKQAQQGGADVSLVTTGEKDTWNKKPSDVQINGTSILDANGVANVPIANGNSAGVVLINGDYGVGKLNNDGLLYAVEASEQEVKAGTAYFHPIMPERQHMSAFYGLAKASGDTTQASSSNAVGVYTNNAKLKIQKMFGLWTPKFALSDTCQEDVTDYGSGSFLCGDVTIEVWEELYVIAYQTNSELGQTIMTNNWGRFLIRDVVNNTYIAHAGYLMGGSPMFLKFKRFPNVLIVENGWVNSIANTSLIRAYTRSADYIDTLRWMNLHCEGGSVKAGTRMEAYIHRFV